MNFFTFLGRIWKCFDCSSIYESISPLYNVSKVFGLAPFTLPPKERTKASEYIIFFLAEAILCCLLYITLYIDQMIDLNLNDTGVLIDLCATLLYIWRATFAIFLIFLNMIFRRKICKILKIINDCDEKLFSTGAKLYFNKHFKYTFLYVVLSVVVDLSLEIYVAVDVDLESVPRLNYVFATYVLSHFIVWIVMSHYLFMMLAVKTRFSALNRNFR